MVPADLLVMVKAQKSTDWREVRTFSLTGLPMVRVGRLRETNDLYLPCRQKGKQPHVSKAHCTLFLKLSRHSYEVMDGAIAPIELGNARARIHPSTSGVIVNEHRLDLGERWLLRDRDTIVIVPGRIALEYRQQREA